MESLPGGWRLNAATLGSVSGLSRIARGTPNHTYPGSQCGRSLTRLGDHNCWRSERANRRGALFCPACFSRLQLVREPCYLLPARKSVIAKYA